VLLGLEGHAKSLSGAVRLTGTNRDLLCGTMGFRVVIIAILHVALDALDMLAASCAASAKLTIFHDLFLSFPEFRILKKSCFLQV
jgi:hypothetical protein